MSATTFVTAYTTALPQHPGGIPSDPARWAAWTEKLEAREALMRASEVARKFHGNASDRTILAWAKRIGAVGHIHVTVVNLKWRESLSRSVRIMEF